jgi:ABC-2 type transport system permease protein
MTGIFLATWIKLRRPALLGGTYLAVAAMTTLFTALTITSAQALPGSAGNPGPAQGPGGGVSLADLAAAGGATEGLSNAVSLLGLVALCVAAAQIAGEHTHGTLRNLLVRQPGRLRLLAGTWAAVVVFTVGAVLVAAIASIVTSFVFAPGEGIDTVAWTSGDGLSASAGSIGLVLAAALGYATIGVVLGLVLRSAVSAVAIGVGWLLVVELVLSTVVDGASRWLPGQLLSAVAAGGTADVALGVAGWTISAFLVIISGAAAVLFTRRDVAA